MDMDRIYAEAIANEYAPEEHLQGDGAQKAGQEGQKRGEYLRLYVDAHEMETCTEERREPVYHLREDYAFKTEACAGVSLGITGLFALYNGHLGLTAGSIWHGSICAFHLVLAAIRALTREPFANPANNFLQYSPLC